MFTDQNLYAIDKFWQYVDKNRFDRHVNLAKFNQIRDATVQIDS
jgi:hypothetical protein